MMNSFPYYLQLFASIFFAAFSVFNTVRSLLGAQFFIAFMFTLMIYCSVQLFKLSVAELKEYKNESKK